MTCMLSLIIFTFLQGGHIFISEGNYMSGGIKVSQYQHSQCGSVGILNDDIRIDDLQDLIALDKVSSINGMFCLAGPSWS